MGHRVLTVAASALVCAACSTTHPRIGDVVPASSTAGTGAHVAIGTVDCAPRFEFDRAALTDDPIAHVRLGNALVLDAHREADERFTFDVPASLAAGSYPLTLELADGRTADAPVPYTVVAPDVRVDAVSSTERAVTTGETGIPLTVTLAATGSCSAVGITVVPRFVSGTTDVSATFRVHGEGAARVDAHATTDVPFIVDVLASAAPGDVRVFADLTGGTRVGDGCAGSIAVTDTQASAPWTVQLPPADDLLVTGLSTSDVAPSPGTTTELTVRVLDLARIDVTVTDVRLQSSPEGALSFTSDGPLPIGRTIPAEQQLAFDARVRIAPTAVAGATVYYGLVVTAVDATGALHTSAAPAVVASLTVGP